MTGPGTLDRRDFVKVLGGGIAVAVSMGPATLLAEGSTQPRGGAEPWTTYLHIGGDGRVTVFSGKIEMGQGVMTSQAQMAAEELGVSVDVVEMVLGDTDRCPWDRGTFGSLTTRMFGPVLRAAAAEAREVMLDLAAGELGADPQALVVEEGVVRHRSDPSRAITYADLARGREITRTVDREAVLRSVEEFAVMGRSVERLDGVEKVTGKAEFAGDIRRPGMLYARILRPPAHGAELRWAETSGARSMEGVEVVERPGLVAVLHEEPETAARALAAIEAEWDLPDPTPTDETIYDHLLSRSPRPDVRHRAGDLQRGRSASDSVQEHRYLNAYVAHAPMEPHTAVAEYDGDRMTLWISTQAPFGDQSTVARALEMPEEKVRVITPFVGGGFGGKTSGQQFVDAARLARITGRPVMVAFTRDEEFFYDTFRPAAVVDMTTGVDAEGRMTLWDYHVHFAGSRGSDLWYDVPNAEIKVSGEWMGNRSGAHPFSVGAWRAPAANTNVFAMESQVDAMAAAAAMDPLAFRLQNTTDPRMRRVLQQAGEAFDWTERAGIRGDGRGRGIACGIDAGTYVALAAEVRVDAASGRIQAERVVCAQDMGIVVNPMGATMQAEGCITMGLGYVLGEEVRFEGGKILDRNFDTYPLPRFSWLPRIEVHLVENDQLAPQGGGEPAIVPMGAVVANAVHDATGVRLFRLPMTPERVKEALAADR